MLNVFHLFLFSYEIRLLVSIDERDAIFFFLRDMDNAKGSPEKDVLLPITDQGSHAANQEKRKPDNSSRCSANQQPANCPSDIEYQCMTSGIAFSGGGIRSAAFCSGVLRRLLEKSIPVNFYLSCVSGGGYTGAAFLDWSFRFRDSHGNNWHEDFFKNMRDNAGYLCNCQSPSSAIRHSIAFVSVIFFTTCFLPILISVPNAFPVAMTVDFLLGDVLRANISCPNIRETGSKRSSHLVLELRLDEDCSPSASRSVLFSLTFIVSIVTILLSRCNWSRRCRALRNHFRWVSALSGLMFIFTFFPWVAHNFVWPTKAWIKVLILFIVLVLPFLFPLIRDHAAIFFGFYMYSYIISWKVFHFELFGQVSYSDSLFYAFLLVSAVAGLIFPIIGPIHRSCLNRYYRYVC